MATKVPISVENIAFERLNLSRHYLTIDCDFTCFLVLNPSGSVPSEGTDICALHVGAWQIDAWTLLTKKDFPNQAGFSACLVWDKTLVVEGSTSVPHVVESDIDTANSISTLKGQPVNITGFSMPAGETLPVSLLGVGDEPISRYNPLPVINNPFELNMTVGNLADDFLLSSYCVKFEDLSDSVRYRISPKRFSVRSSTYAFSFFYDKFSYDAGGQIRKYLSVDLPSVNVFVDKTSHLYTHFTLNLRGTPLYTDPTNDVLVLSGTVPGDTPNVVVVEV